jgi:hypothetical protein
MLDWFDASAAIAFGKHMAQEVAKIVPIEAAGASRKGAAKQQEKFQRAIMRASELRGKTPLNFYKKARCAHALRWSLIDSGYPKEFVEEVVRLVITKL